jgi:hypothetical protein
MDARLKPRSIYDVFAVIGCVAAIGSGTAYAANTVFSTDIVDGEVKTEDIGYQAVIKSNLAPNSVTSNKLVDGTIANADLAADSVNGASVVNSSLTGDDVASSSLTGIDVANGSLTSSDILDETLGTTKIADGGLNTSDLAISSITGSRIAASAVTTSDIANRTVNMDDIDGADRSGSIDVGAISNGRCATISGSVTGAQPGDAAVLTTNGAIPTGMTITAQRALTDAVHIKVCNLTGATSAAITDLPVRVITFH